MNAEETGSRASMIQKRTPACAVIVLTNQALVTGKRIVESLKDRVKPELWVHQRCLNAEGPLPRPEEGEVHSFERLAEILPEVWTRFSLLIFVMAAGIVVRQIAPFIQKKDRDPAVLVLDEKGQFVISLLSGHLGGANDWAREIAERLQAQPVITTATDVHGFIAPDEYARRLGWNVQPLEGLKKANRFLLECGNLTVWSEVPLVPEHPLKKDTHYRFVSKEHQQEAQIWLTPFQTASVGEPKSVSEEKEGKRNFPWIVLVPKIVSVGVGSRRGISKETVLEAIRKALSAVGVAKESIAGMYSIDQKQQEGGIIEAAQALDVPFLTFGAAEIQSMIDQYGLSRSEYVQEKMGVDGVCEAASLLGTRHGVLLLPKQKHSGVTVAISMERFLS